MTADPTSVRAGSPPQLTHPKYRPDIDGLRAVAVLSVVGFHAFPDWVRGGFVGVDVFFVISGFLISSILVDNLAKGSFSFREFYARRIKRIFPALILVLTACGLYGWFVLLDDEFRQLGKHIAGGAGFVSNLVLWSETGYFDKAAETKPLLHLWSLGIEEQFYIAWPLILYLGFRRGISFFRLALVIAALSFALNIASLGGEPEATFYSPFTRFWQLLAGGLLACTKGQRSSVPGAQLKTGAVQSAVGAALIGIAVLLLTKNNVFPGWWALLPTVGAYLLISAGPQAWFNRVVLSHPAMVWVGLISYPLYLWHWPLLTFARIAAAGTPPLATRVALVLVAVVLSWLTYRLVEKPIRRGKRGNAVVIGLCALMLGIGVAGYAAYRFGNAAAPTGVGVAVGSKPQFVDNQSAFDWPLFKDRHTFAELKKHCHDMLPVKFPYCLIQVSLLPPTVALIGDSHAPRMYEAVAATVATSGGSLVMVGKDGCPPFLGVERDKKGCPATMKSITDFVTTSSSIGTVLVTGRFSAAISGTEPVGDRPPEWFSLTRVDRPDITDRAVIFELGLEEMLTTLTAAGKRVILMHENPELDFDPRACLPERGGRSCLMSRKAVDDRQAEYRRVVALVLSRNSAVEQLDLLPYFCAGGDCLAASDGFVLYSDNHHLGPNAAPFLANSQFPADLARLMSPEGSPQSR